MATRSGVLARWHSVVGTLISPAFTVPVTDTWLLKELRVYNQTVAANILAACGDGAGVEKAILLVHNAAPIGSTDVVSMWLAMGPGDVVQFQSSQAGTYFYLSGADLPGHL